MLYYVWVKISCNCSFPQRNHSGVGSAWCSWVHN